MRKKRKTEKDFWIEMSIREISTQAQFASIAYDNIDPKAGRGNDIVFSSIHSFLSHCAMVSKMLQATEDGQKNLNPCIKYFIKKLNIKRKKHSRGISIGKVLGVSEQSIIHKRKFRNHLEHYDERLKKWIRKKGVNVNIGTYNIGPKEAFNIKNFVYVSHYDPSKTTFTFVDEDFDLSLLNNEIVRIKRIADTWVQSLK